MLAFSLATIHTLRRAPEAYNSQAAASAVNVHDALAGGDAVQTVHHYVHHYHDGALHGAYSDDDGFHAVSGDHAAYYGHGLHGSADGHSGGYYHSKEAVAWIGMHEYGGVRIKNPILVTSNNGISILKHKLETPVEHRMHHNPSQYHLAAGQKYRVPKKQGFGKGNNEDSKPAFSPVFREFLWVSF